MSAPLKPSIARIYNAQNEVVGAGFIISKSQLLTCAHVVAQALEIPAETCETPSSRVKFDLPFKCPGRKLDASVVYWQPLAPNADSPRNEQEDIAVLQIDLDSENAIELTPIRLTNADNVWNDSFRAFGFPPSYDEGVWAKGKLMDRQGNNWIQIEGENRGGYSVTPGFSGTPVWDDDLEGVVGMVVVSDSRSEAKTAFIIPTSTLVSAWPSLQDIVDAEVEHELPQEDRQSAVASPAEADAPLFWTDSDQRYKAFHRADRRASNYRPDVLVVFVGPQSSTPTWNFVPAEVLSAAGVDVDVLSVEYASIKPNLKAIRAAAASLGTLLSTSFEIYRHLFFVVLDHDLVVKQMLIEDSIDIPEYPGQFQDSRLLCRCRSVMVLASNSGRPRSHAATKSIENSFEKHRTNYETIGLPTPEIVKVPVALFETFESEEFHLQNEGASRPTRTSSVRTPLAVFLAARLSALRSYWAVAVSRHTIARTFAIDPQVRMLFGGQEIPADAETSSAGLSQVEVLQRLIAAASSPSREHLYVLTGSAGVGKSVLLRMLARRLSISWLRGTKGAALPLVFPLSQFTLNVSDPNPQNLWKQLSDEWIAWVNELLASNAGADEVLRPDLTSVNQLLIYNQLRRMPTTLILDGVDEFMEKHPGLSLTDFVLLLRYLLTTFRENAGLMTVVGIRSSARDVTLIAESESQVITLRGMAPSEASAVFPGAMKFVSPASDAAVQKLLLTPLILSSLEKSNLRLKPEAYLNRAGLVHAALVALIASLMNAWSGARYTSNAWITALSLIAWYQFRELRGEIDDKYVAGFAGGVVEAWSNPPGAEDKSEVVDAFRILLERQARSTLLRRSIFLPIRENSYRLRHKEWGDYLVSLYASLCIRHRQFDDLSIRALNHDIYIMAGQQLQESDTERDTIKALVQRASSENRFLILGNFAQMLGASFAPLTGDVLDQEILAKLHLFPSVVKFAMLSALSSRVLLDDKEDPWKRHIRLALLKALKRYANDESENALIRSLCWCFLQAITKTDTAWPGLWTSEKSSVDALSMISSQDGDQFVVDLRQFSIQLAFMRIQYYALEIPSRIISTIHYLYPLVLASNREISLDRSVLMELPSLLSDPRIDATYRNYPVREVSQIWQRCKELYV